MPTSPKTAKEIIEELHYQFCNDNCDLPNGGKCDYGLKGLEAFLLSSLRAAIEAVRPNKEEEQAYMWAQQDFDDNVRRFFKDYSTSPPTPRN